MTTAATTTRPAIGHPNWANTPKHAFAPFAPFGPRSSTASNVTLPAQRPNLDLWPVGPASATSRHDFYVSVGVGTASTAVLVHNCPFYRGSPVGEEPSMQLKPGEYRMTGAGQVRGLSLFDNPEAIESRGMVPNEVDESTLSDELSIEQRGGNADHFEIVPSDGAFPPEEEFQGQLDGVGFVGGG